MTREEFLLELLEVLQRDDPITMDTRLEDLAEWDSLASMGVASMLDLKFSRRLSFDEIRAMRTVSDIARAAGLEL